ncbi:MAG: TIGR04255 family protein [Planctomycetota bacterium]
MSTWPRLSKAPIVEGLIDIRVEPSASASGTALKAAADELAAEFPSRSELHAFVAQFQIAPTPPAPALTTADTPQGFILRSLDEKWVAQFRVDGFTVSRLHPYSDWEELKTKTAALWSRYLAAAKPAKVVRIACRYINRVPLPVGESFDKTFLTSFAVGPSLPQSVAGYLLRVALPFEEQNALAILTQSLEGNATDCILDIDVFSENPQGIDQASLWDKLGNLRDIKNRIFFGSFTEAALERFK